jgi:hypothetical protein
MLYNSLWPSSRRPSRKQERNTRNIKKMGSNRKTMMKNSMKGKNSHRKNKLSNNKYKTTKIWLQIRRDSFLRGRMIESIILSWVLGINFNHSRIWMKKKYLIISISLTVKGRMNRLLRMSFRRALMSKRSLNKPISTMIMRKNSLRKST